MADDLIEQARQRAGRSVRRLIGGTAEARSIPLSRSDPGLFGPDSVTWIVHASPAMLVGGLRALLYQTLHPLVMAGVAQHSNYRKDPLGRLHRTASFVGMTTYGSSEEAAAAIRQVRSVHRGVKGTAPDGRTYSASDPHLIAWVHCTEVDSFLQAYQRYGSAPLADDEADQYVAEMAEVGTRLGGKRLPTDTASLAANLAGFEAELVCDRTVLETVAFLLFPPIGVRVRPTYALVAAAAVELLPPTIRRRLWLPTLPGADRLLVSPAARALLAGLGWALRPAA